MVNAHVRVRVTEYYSRYVVPKGKFLCIIAHVEKNREIMHENILFSEIKKRLTGKTLINVLHYTL